MNCWHPTCLGLLSILLAPQPEPPPFSGYAGLVDIQPVGVLGPIPGGLAWNIQGDPPPEDPTTRFFDFMVRYEGTSLGGVPLSSTSGTVYTVKIEDIQSATPSVTLLDSTGAKVTGPGGQGPTFTKWQSTVEDSLPGFALFPTPVSATSHAVRVYAVLDGSGIAIDYSAATTPEPVTDKPQVKVTLDPSGTLVSMPRARLTYEMKVPGTGGDPSVDVAGTTALTVGGSAVAAAETLRITGTNLEAGATGAPGLTGKNLTTGAITPVTVSGSSTMQGWVTSPCVVAQVGSSAETAVVRLLQGERSVAFEVTETP